MANFMSIVANAGDLYDRHSAPKSHLSHQHRLLATVRDLARDWNMGAMAIVHDPNLAARHADTIAFLADGTIIAQGPPRDVMRPDLIEQCYGFAVRMRDAGSNSAPVAVPA